MDGRKDRQTTYDSNTMLAINASYGKKGEKEAQEKPGRGKRKGAIAPNFNSIHAPGKVPAQAVEANMAALISGISRSSARHQYKQRHVSDRPVGQHRRTVHVHSETYSCARRGCASTG